MLLPVPGAGPVSKLPMLARLYELQGSAAPSQPQSLESYALVPFNHAIRLEEEKWDAKKYW